MEDKLRSGASVTDIGCGLGASTILLARAYPNSRFTGSDYHDQSIELARKHAGEAGVADRVSFEVSSILCVLDELRGARQVRSVIVFDASEPAAHPRLRGMIGIGDVT